MIENWKMKNEAGLKKAAYKRKEYLGAFIASGSVILECRVYSGCIFELRV